MPHVLDLFCCAGGAGTGYQRAGFRVTGVDIIDRPNNPHPFVRADALRFLEACIADGSVRSFDLIHASPPCQAAAAITMGTNRSRDWGRGREKVQLVPPVRALLDESGVPYVIEQPTGHGGLIRADVTLCMDMFPVGVPPWVQRHRDFEVSGFDVERIAHPRGPVRGHRGYVRGHRHGVVREGPYVAAYGAGGGKATIAEMQHALGIDWTDVREELTEAIPPAYTEWLGGQFLRAAS